jgi:hypothetical protein
MIFNDILETQVFELFVSSELVDCSNPYAVAQHIFKSFFAVSSNFYTTCSNKPLFAEIIYKYIALIPMLCK